MQITKALTLSAALLLGAASAVHADDGAVKLIGKGGKRDALSAQCYKPFDITTLGQLEGWAGGTAPTAASAKGKPVLIIAWASWFKTSHAALIEAQKAADKNKDLIVVAVHHKTRFTDAPGVIAANKITFSYAHDANGEFLTKVLRVEGAGPNLYLVDRAGNLRFADFDRASLDEAVKIVSAESAEDAAKAEARFKESQKAKGETPMGGPDVKARPDPEAYKSAAWPQVNKGVQHAKNVQGKMLPVALGKETWISAKPDLSGKVIVLDFWATWCPPCIAASPLLDDLQTKHKDNVVVIGMSGQGDNLAKIKNYVKGHPTSYFHAFDSAQNVYKSLSITGIPHVVVMSTDGIVRWQGNPHAGEFTSTVEKVMKADPWVANRSKAKKG